MSMIERATISTRRTDQLRSQRWLAGAGAAIWGFGYGLVSLYWALGGRVGLHQLGVGIQEQVAAHDTALVVSLWAAVVAKLVAGALGVALMVPLDRIVPRWLLLLGGWVAGIGLTLYGLAGIIQAALVTAGVAHVPRSMGEHAVRWYLLLWEPIWLVGGILFLIAMRAYQLTSRDEHRGATRP